MSFESPITVTQIGEEEYFPEELRRLSNEEDRPHSGHGYQTSAAFTKGVNLAAATLPERVGLAQSLDQFSGAPHSLSKMYSSKERG